MSDNTQMKPMLTDEGEVDERTTAFQVWAMLADRSPKKTQAILMDQFGIEIKINTLYKWAQRYEWSTKARDLFEDTAPTFFERTRAAIVGGTPAAATYLVGVADGSQEPDRNRILAAFGLIDRAGFLPYTRREAEEGKNPIARRGVVDDEYLDLSHEELRAIVSGRVADLAGNETGDRT